MPPNHVCIESHVMTNSNNAHGIANRHVCTENYVGFVSASEDPRDPRLVDRRFLKPTNNRTYSERRHHLSLYQLHILIHGSHTSPFARVMRN